jgi:flagellar basal body-associated protein FliL
MQCPHPFSGEYEDMANQDEDKNTSRTILLLLVTALLAVASVVLGFYLLRNTLADSFAFIYFARGTELSRQDAAKLEQDLKSDLVLLCYKLDTCC